MKDYRVTVTFVVLGEDALAAEDRVVTEMNLIDFQYETIKAEEIESVRS